MVHMTQCQQGGQTTPGCKGPANVPTSKETGQRTETTNGPNNAHRRLGHRFFFALSFFFISLTNLFSGGGESTMMGETIETAEGGQR